MMRDQDETTESLANPKETLKLIQELSKWLETKDGAREAEVWGLVLEDDVDLTKVLMNRLHQNKIC